MVNFSDIPRDDSVQFFEKILKQHDRVDSYRQLGNFVYQIHLDDGQTYRIWLTNKYTVSVNDVVEKIDENLDGLVTISGWNDYTYEAKEYALKNHFGLFKIREFMGALNFPDPSQYYMGIDEEDGKKLYGERNYKFN